MIDVQFSHHSKNGHRKMKIACYVSVLCFFISACSAPTIQQKRDSLLENASVNPYSSTGSQDKSIYDTRAKLIQYGGETPEFLKKLTDKCYGLPYESGQCAINVYSDELKTKQDEACDKESSCVIERETKSAIDNLNQQYYFVMARNQYDQAEFDLNIRALCKAAGIGQRGGISLMQVEYDVNQEPGLSPEVRGQFREIAMSCWTLSKNGIADGTTKIKNIY